MAINFVKMSERREIVIDLKKNSGLADQKASVVLCLDFSYSMQQLYDSGVVQDVVERILPLGLAFDDNKEVDFYLFENDYNKLPENITLKNVDGYINSKVLRVYRMGGTSYAPVLNAIFDDFKPNKPLFGSIKPLKHPVYIIFITDGENDDHTRTEAIVRKMSEYGFFIQFVGIGPERFTFLNKLDALQGRKIDNANFFPIKDIKTISDDVLYANLMTEFPGWVTAARSLSLIE